MKRVFQIAHATGFALSGLLGVLGIPGFLCLLAPVPASTQTLDLGEKAKLHYRGNAGLIQWAFPQEGGSRQSRFATQWVGELDMTLSFAAAIPLEFRIHPRLNYDIDRDQGFDGPEALPARFDDLYADYFTRWFELRAGYQVFSWKVVESYSQADILNQADREEDFFDPPKIGEPAVRARIILPSRTPNVLELYYLPRFTPSPLPGEESRYYFFQDDQIRLARDGENFLYGSSDGRDRPQWAVRWQTQAFDAFDIAGYWFHGYRRFPLFRPAAAGTGGDGPAVALTHFYPVEFQGGFTFQGALGNWLWKGETAYHRFEEELTATGGGEVDPYLAYTAGFEYTFYSPFRQNQDLGAILELIGDTDAGKEEADLEGFRPFRSTAFAALRYTFNTSSDRAVLAGAFLDYLEADVLYRAEYSERLFDRLALKAEVSGVSARSRSQFRPFQQAARVAVEAKLHF